MESANISKEEILDLIIYGLEKNDIDPSSISNHGINFILNRYLKYCEIFRCSFLTLGSELDTFKRAACLLVAINDGHYLKITKKEKAAFALDTAFKMCEKPYWNVGKKGNEPYKLEEVDFSIDLDEEVYDTSKETLTLSLLHEKAQPWHGIWLNLQMMYQLALEIKHRNNLKKAVKNIKSKKQQI